MNLEDFNLISLPQEELENIHGGFIMSFVCLCLALFGTGYKLGEALSKINCDKAPKPTVA